VRIALALQQEQAEALRQERDLWAKRAQLLAAAMSQEAGDVTSNSGQTEAEASMAHGQGRPSASMRVVA
jgi:hypothetical protein